VSVVILEETPIVAHGSFKKWKLCWFVVLSEPGHVFIRALKNFLEVEETPFISRLNKNSNDKAGKE